MYIDGVVQNLTEGSSPSGDPSSDAASNLSIGNFDTSGPRTFNGLIDDVRIYNRALSPDEIKRLYITGAAGKLGVAANNDSLAQGLVGYWTFDGKDMAGAMGITSARTAYDRSGNGNNGKYWNATNTPAVNGKLGQALEFDGSNNYVNISDPANGSLDFGSESFSISA
jgi:Concanavalin A-like lectin/glucanases superfamily